MEGISLFVNVYPPRWYEAPVATLASGIAAAGFARLDAIAAAATQKIIDIVLISFTLFPIADNWQYQFFRCFSYYTL